MSVNTLEGCDSEDHEVASLLPVASVNYQSYTSQCPLCVGFFDGAFTDKDATQVSTSGSVGFRDCNDLLGESNSEARGVAGEAG